MRKDTIHNYELVQKAVYHYGTMSPTEIRNIIKSTSGKNIGRSTIHKYLHQIRESNQTWLSDQAKAGYIETVRTIIRNKKQRIAELETERKSCPNPRTKVYYAEVINNTEDSVRTWMEGTPLLMMFNDMMNGHEQKDTITIST